VAKNIDQQRIRGTQNVDKIYTRININGARYSDKMWIFTDPDCTRDFDNGWDGAKFLGNSVSPQLWAMESAGDYQVDAVDNINNTYLGFLPGEDTDYKLTFTHKNSEAQYPTLFLIDLQEKITTDITRSGTTYSFSSIPTTNPVKRFKIVTSLDLETDNSSNENDVLKIFSKPESLIVTNSSSLTGTITIYDITGKIIQTALLNAKGTTTIPLSLTTGSYMVRAFTSLEQSTKTVVILKF